MGVLLKGYGSYLLPVKHGTSTTDPSSLFDVQGKDVFERKKFSYLYHFLEKPGAPTR